MTGSEPTAPPDDGPTATPLVPTPRTASRHRDTRHRDDASPPAGLAWLARPVTHVPGVLRLEGGRLRFVSTRGVIFDDTPEALAVTPTRTGRGVFRLAVDGERLRLHVVRFAGAVDVAADLVAREAAGGLLTAGEASAATPWRRLLATPGEAAGAQPDDQPGAPATEAAGRTLRGRGWRPARARRACATPGQSY